MHHFGDPCIHCGTPHDNVPVGPCQGNPKKAKPIAYRSLSVRWDKVEHFRIRWSDGRVTESWNHISESAPYFHFGHSDRLVQPPRYDERLLAKGK
jgi:hypothetical protein